MRLRSWVWVVAVTAILPLSMGGLVIRAKRQATVALARHEREVKDRIAELRSRVWKRPVLFGPELPGNGWDAYAAALDTLDAIPEAAFNRIPGIGEDSDAFLTGEQLDVFLEVHKGIVEGLKSSCRRATFTPPYAYEDGFGMLLPYVSKAIKASKYLAAAARRLHERGMDREALDPVLLALAAGQETGAGGPLVNFLVQGVCEGNGIDAAREVLASHRMSPAELEEFARAVDLLYGSRTGILEALEVDGTTTRVGFLEVARSPKSDALVGGGRTLRQWKYAYSVDVLVAGGLNDVERFFDRIPELRDLPPAQRKKRADQLVDETLKQGNPLVGLVLPALSRTFRTAAAQELNWTLLRVSTAIARYETEKGTLPKSLADLVPAYLPSIPSCPYTGTPLRYEPGKLWSIGGDLKDDGGVPLKDPEDIDSPGDAVWTVKRK